MTSKERIIAALSHREADRVPFLEEPWSLTLTRWIGEGLTETQPFDVALGIDPFIKIRLDNSFRLPEKTIEETDEYIIRQDSNGAWLRTFKNSESTPEVVKTTINSRSAWEEHKHLLEFTPERLNLDENTPVYEKARRQDYFVHFSMNFCYERWGRIVGLENYLIALIEDPQWIREMHQADIRLFLEAYEEMTARGMHFDGARFSNDMGYRNGPLFSPQLYREIFQPGLERLCDYFHDRGLFTILHSCGNVNDLISDFIQTGFDSLNPVEVKAGMDLLKLKKMYGEQLCFMGGIDARKMSDSEQIITEEIRSKVGEAKKGGGYIFHSDHSVPDTVSLEQFKRIIELAFEHGRYG